MKIPNGFENVSNDVVYFNPTTNEIIVIGEVADGHYCVHMGCSSGNHVVFRGKLESWSYSPPYRKVGPYIF